MPTLFRRFVIIHRFVDSLARGVSEVPDLTNGQQIHEKMLNILNIREMQIKTPMRYLLTCARMAIIKKTRDCKCW